MHEKSYRSFVKAFTWRTVAFADTALLALIFTGHVGQAVAIGGLEIATKSVLYYAHERGWLRLAAWRDRRQSSKESWRESHIFALLKAVSWRVVGSIDTFFIALFVTRSLGLSASIGVAELVTKTALYYLHERAWLKSRWGTQSAKSRLLPGTASSTSAA